MTRAVLLLVLLVSVAHALVHIFELSLPSVEQLIAAEYRPDDAAAGKVLSGKMANTWRLPFGLGALLAGWLVDRLGSRAMLAVYLLGCGAACLLAATVQPLSWLFLSMLAMGSFAAIYHPAGLALISHEVEPEVLPRALGLHGIFGSLGIGGAPFLAGAVLSLNVPPQWRHVYWVLAVPGLLLGAYFAALAIRQANGDAGPQSQSATTVKQHESARWTAFVTLTFFAVMMGFTYAAVLSFLPRYMDGVHWQLPTATDAGLRNYLAGGVLLVGCVGQYLAGRFARSDRLEWQLTLITLGNIPGLVAMAVATGPLRIAAAVAWALVHFMHQPVYNSLIAKYTPRSRRSLCYGFSFAMGFGFGSFGARFAGRSTSDLFTFGSLAGIVVAATLLCLVLWWWDAARKKSQPS